MFAIVGIGGKQYRAEVGSELLIDRLGVEQGAVVELPSLLVVGDDGIRLTGESDPVTVSARVLEHVKGPKVTILKHKPKRGFQRKMGFRSSLTRVAIDKIG